MVRSYLVEENSRTTEQSNGRTLYRPPPYMTARVRNDAARITHP
jgi:hypothetical protein